MQQNRVSFDEIGKLVHLLNFQSQSDSFRIPGRDEVRGHELVLRQKHSFADDNVRHAFGFRLDDQSVKVACFLLIDRENACALFELDLILLLFPHLTARTGLSLVRETLQAHQIFQSRSKRNFI